MSDDSPPFQRYQDAVRLPGEEQDATRSPRYGAQDAAVAREPSQARVRPRSSTVTSRVSATATDVIALAGVIVAAVLLGLVMTWAMVTLPGGPGVIR